MTAPSQQPRDFRTDHILTFNSIVDSTAIARSLDLLSRFPNSSVHYIPETANGIRSRSSYTDDFPSLVDYGVQAREEVAELYHHMYHPDPVLSSHPPLRPDHARFLFDTRLPSSSANNLRPADLPSIDAFINGMEGSTSVLAPFPPGGSDMPHLGIDGILRLDCPQSEFGSTQPNSRRLPMSSTISYQNILCDLAAPPSDVENRGARGLTIERRRIG